jgi:short-subunit dehydrogenase
MAINLKDKKVLITGSSDGLGRLLAIELAKLGANIIIHGKNEEKLSEVFEEVKNANREGDHASIVCDLSKPEAIESAFGEIGQLDILINNAGVWLEGDFGAATSQKMLELVNVNLASYILCLKTLIPILEKSEFGQVLNVISVAGIEVPTDSTYSVYCATKFGLQGFTEALAKEYENKNIRVMGYYPGGMDTGIFEKAGRNYGRATWMFDPMESVEAIIFMLTRNPKVTIKRMDLLNYLQK